MDGWTLDRPSGWMIIRKGSVDKWMDIGPAKRMEENIERLKGWMDGWTLDRPSRWTDRWQDPADARMDGQAQWMDGGI